ncbi:hypothetical protein OAV01_05395 [Opitutales bacterium]|nr:hypothetical protein [Opitutales bacterium]
MSDQILKLFNITPHVFLSEKDRAGRSIDTDTLNEIWHNEIINNVYPDPRVPKSHDVGGVLLSIPDSDMQRFIKFLMEKGLLDMSVVKFLKNLQYTRRLCPSLKLNLSNEELMISEKLLLNGASETEICGSVCSTRILKSDRPSRCMDSSDILSAPPWWRGPKEEPEVIFTEDFIKDKLSNLLGFAKTYELFDNFLLGKLKVDDKHNDQYSDIIKIFQRIGCKIKGQALITIHVQKVSNGKPTVTNANINDLKHYLNSHRNLLKKISKISVKQWNFTHDRHVCTDLGGFSTGFGTKNPEFTGKGDGGEYIGTRKPTSFFLLSPDSCIKITSKYRGNISRTIVQGKRVTIRAEYFSKTDFPNADKNEIVVFSS